jgi:GT2 family glycosyltransferase
MVSIIILSFNTKELLRSSLASVYKHLSEAFEVIIVDNNSHDDSVAMIKKEFPKVHVIENKENVGFAKGVNLGANRAEGDYLLFLNSDAELMDDHVFKMVAYMKEHTKAGVVGGNLLEQAGRTSRSYGDFYTLQAVASLLFGGAKKQASPSGTHPKLVDWVSGGYMLVRADIFRSLGGFDEAFFMYIEDMELCYRMKKEGFQVYFFPEAKAKHVGQGSSNRTFAITHIYQGLLYFYKKHKSMPEYFLVKLMLRIKAYLAICIGILTRNSYLINTYRKAIQFT